MNKIVDLLKEPKKYYYAVSDEDVAYALKNHKNVECFFEEWFYISNDHQFVTKRQYHLTSPLYNLDESSHAGSSDSPVCSIEYDRYEMENDEYIYICIVREDWKCKWFYAYRSSRTFHEDSAPTVHRIYAFAHKLGFNVNITDKIRMMSAKADVRNKKDMPQCLKPEKTYDFYNSD